jgi:hypothetical protein
MAAVVWHCWVGTGRLLALGAARTRLAAVVEHLRGRHQRSARLMGSARSADGADKEVMAFRTPTSMALHRHYLPLVCNALGAVWAPIRICLSSAGLNVPVLRLWSSSDRRR